MFRSHRLASIKPRLEELEGRDLPSPIIIAGTTADNGYTSATAVSPSGSGPYQYNNTQTNTFTQDATDSTSASSSIPLPPGAPGAPGSPGFAQVVANASQTLTPDANGATLLVSNSSVNLGSQIGGQIPSATETGTAHEAIHFQLTQSADVVVTLTVNLPQSAVGSANNFVAQALLLGSTPIGQDNPSIEDSFFVQNLNGTLSNSNVFLGTPIPESGVPFSLTLPAGEYRLYTSIYASGSGAIDPSTDVSATAQLTLVPTTPSPSSPPAAPPPAPTLAPAPTPAPSTPPAFTRWENLVSSIWQEWENYIQSVVNAVEAREAAILTFVTQHMTAMHSPNQSPGH